MDETGIPSLLVETLCPQPVADVAGRHKRVKHENRRSTPAVRAGEKICMDAVVFRECGADGALPAQRRGSAFLVSVILSGAKRSRRTFNFFRARGVRVTGGY